MHKTTKKILKTLYHHTPKQVISNIPDKIITQLAPYQIVIEPTTLCNLNCPLCPRQKLTRTQGNMKFKEFKKIIAKLPKTVNSMELYFMGEPLMNKDIFKMVKYAEENNISTKISTNTMLVENYIDEIFDSKLSNLIVTLDGATKKSHESYRIGSDFDKITKTIKRLCKTKKNRNINKPEITLQFLVMKQNENEIEKVIKLSKELNVDHLTLKNISIGTENKTDIEKLKKKYLPDNKKYIRHKYHNKSDICYWAFCSVILWNGDITICCYDFDGKYVLGNAIKEDFNKIYKSKKYSKIRKKIIKRELDICKKCDFSSNTNINIF